MSTRLAPVDVVLVGFGWTAAIMGHVLTEAGLNVLALERGKFRDTVPDFATTPCWTSFATRCELAVHLSDHEIDAVATYVALLRWSPPTPHGTTMTTCLQIAPPRNSTPRRRTFALALAALLGQPLTVDAQASTPASAAPGTQPAGLGTGTAPPAAGMSIPEPVTKDASSVQAGSGRPLNDAHAALAPNDPPGEWHSQARDYANTRYSPLDQITAANVARLRVAWSFSDGTPNGHEAAPLVVGDTMYIVTPFPNLAYALDLTKAGAPIKWSYDPKPTPLAIGKACCDTVNRGSAYADGKLIYNLLDAHTIAIDAKTGKEVWRTKMGDATRGVTMTMAPFVVGDKVYVGNSGGELGVWGWLAALDVKTGKELWRAHSSGTDKQVMIGADFKPFYSWMKGKDLGKTSWPAGMWKTGAGAVWGWVSYDPETNLIYYGTSNPGPRVPSQRPGYNLWTSAVFARDATTGMAKWAYQFT
ncbi:MAG: PQQ-binding-like beta-propeller repeat protein, partial [Caldimonas sp.]